MMYRATLLALAVALIALMIPWRQMRKSTARIRPLGIGSTMRPAVWLTTPMLLIAAGSWMCPTKVFTRGVRIGSR